MYVVGVTCHIPEKFLTLGERFCNQVLFGGLSSGGLDRLSQIFLLSLHFDKDAISQFTLPLDIV